MKVRWLVSSRKLLLFVAFALITSSGMAIPTLQLDILGGTYDPVTETILSNGSTFTLLALLTPGNGMTESEVEELLGYEYYISAALTPQVETGADLGSFDFDGTTVDATDDMVYGVPPIDIVQGHDAGDLPKHGIFPTYFSEFGFMFDGTSTTSAYNSAEYPGGSLFDPTGEGAYFASFNVSTSSLASGYELHFDLYGAEPQSPDIDITQFAPFSHDGGSQVPEPGTSLLLGSGLLLLFALHRRRRRK
jgi:hypothetical protein